jgi:ferredoxin-NADP reductase
VEKERSKVQVYAQEQLTSRLWKLTILAKELGDYTPGQYYTFFNEELVESYPFSVASSINDLPFLYFYSRHPWLYDKGESLFLSTPKGAMTALDPNKKYILCARGTGLTPFLSLLMSHAQKDILTCYWDCWDQEDIVLKESVSGVLCITQDSSFTQVLRDYLKKKEYCYYLAGPLPFVQELNRFLLDSGVEKPHIVSDMIR